MARVSGVLFELIKSVIKNQEFDANLKNELTEQIVGEACLLAKKHDLAHLLGVAFSKNGINVNDDLKNKLEREQMLAIMRYERSIYDYQLLCEWLEKSEIAFIPLKGSIIRDYYPEPWMRTSCDIDVLVSKDSAMKAIDILCQKAGFTRDKDFTTHDYILISPSGGTIELHYSLLQDGALPKTDEVLNSVWQNVDEQNSKGYKKQLTGAFFVFYHIVHMAKHFIGGGCGVRPFIDLYIIREKFSYEKDALAELLAKVGLTEFFDAVLQLIDVWFNNKEHNQTTEKMQNFLLSGGVYGTLDNSATVQAAKGKSKSKTFWGLIFLPRKNLEIIYPNLKKHGWLLPFYQMKRWFRVFKKDNRNKAHNIIKARNSVSDSNVTETEKLLKNLGLK